MTEVVWLSNSFSRIAHDTAGKVDDFTWKTLCGRMIQQRRVSEPTVRQYGSLIRWDHLNHERIQKCKTCFKGVSDNDE